MPSGGRAARSMRAVGWASSVPSPSRVSRAPGPMRGWARSWSGRSRVGARAMMPTPWGRVCGGSRRGRAARSGSSTGTTGSTADAATSRVTWRRTGCVSRRVARPSWAMARRARGACTGSSARPGRASGPTAGSAGCARRAGRPVPGAMRARPMSAAIRWRGGVCRGPIAERRAGATRTACRTCAVRGRRRASGRVGPCRGSARPVTMATSGRRCARSGRGVEARCARPSRGRSSRVRATCAAARRRAGPGSRARTSCACKRAWATSAATHTRPTACWTDTTGARPTSCVGERDLHRGEGRG